MSSCCARRTIIWLMRIIGNLERERPDERQRRSFDLFHYGLHGLVVVTFDELFAKVRDLVALIQQGQGAGSQQN